MKMQRPPIYSWLAIAIVIVLVFTQTVVRSAVYRQGIVLNQVGYCQNCPKVALLMNLQELGANVEIMEVNRNRTVASVIPSVPLTDPGSGDTLRSVDFSAVTEAGTYRLRYGNVESVAFEIGSSPLAEATRLLLRSYSLQRCGIALNDPETGGYCWRRSIRITSVILKSVPLVLRGELPCLSRLSQFLQFPPKQCASLKLPFQKGILI